MPNLTITYTPPVFPNYTQPLGKLPSHIGAQALWYYYLLVQKALELESETIVLEGTVHLKPDYTHHFLSVAQVYGLDPAVMVKFWKYVDAQADEMGFPRLPTYDKIRFNIAPKVN